MSRTTMEYIGVISYTAKRPFTNAEKKIKKPATRRQKEQRTKFARVISFLTL